MARSPKQAGTTLLETIIGLTLLTIVAVALITLIANNIASLFSSKARAAAVLLAQEKIEDLKNLPYDSLATQAGSIYPSGSILDDESVVRNNVRLKIHTDIRYTDDPYDGDVTGSVPAKPTDIYPYDYKKVTVDVYAETSGKKYATLSTHIAAKAAETAGNTGVLIVRVINANGQPVDGAQITITNPNPSPAVNVNTTTDIAGQAIIPKLPPDTTTGYHVVATKAGFSSDQTIAISAQYPSPTNPDFGMVAQQTIVKTFAIDSLASIGFTIVKTDNSPLTNTPVTIYGQKTINTTPEIYKTSQIVTTSDQGVAQLNLIDWDSYSLSISGYDILSISPYQPVVVSAGSNTTARVVVAAQPNNYPIIRDGSPQTAATGSSAVIDITGSHLSGTTSLRLRRNGQADIIASGVSYTAPDLLSGTFDLTNAPAGSWDIVLTNGSYSTTQTNGLVVQ